MHQRRITRYEEQILMDCGGRAVPGFYTRLETAEGRALDVMTAAINRLSKPLHDARVRSAEAVLGGLTEAPRHRSIEVPAL